MSSIDLKSTPKLLQQQRLILTQELQLFLKLIQMTSLELKEYLEEQLVENPVLEEKNEEEKTEEEKNSKDENSSSEEQFDFNADEKSFLNSGDDNQPYFKEIFEDYDEESPWENRVSSTESLLDYLRWQLSLSDFSPEEREIASIILGNINEEGYLEADIEEVALQRVKQEFQADPKLQDVLEEERAHFYENRLKSDNSYFDKVTDVLRKIQSSFDPTGVCARDLKECLRIQAEELGYKEGCVLLKMIANHLEDISNHDYKKISYEMGIALEEVEETALIISSLEPKPGRPFYQKDTEKYIVPDFYVYQMGNDLQIQLNRDFPKIRISQYYRNLISKGNNLPTDAKKYIKEKIEAAQRIMKCLEERDEAIRKIIKKIIEFQKDFFEHGRDYIKPLRLKDIAQSAGVHESTVSRITSRRYIYTPNGVIELKSLFSRKIETAHGADVSFEKVKSVIKDIVSDEMPESPYSDEDISKILERRNIKVARRTVAKYRKILKIPSSSERAIKKR